MEAFFLYLLPEVLKAIILIRKTTRNARFNNCRKIDFFREKKISDFVVFFVTKWRNRV